MPSPDRTNPADGSKRPASWDTRAPRHNLQLTIRYRRQGQMDWRKGETINISRSGILFASTELLEVDAPLEIMLHTSTVSLPHSSKQRAVVVRRALNNWPDTNFVFGIRYCN